jgi:hypothetical protein
MIGLILIGTGITMLSRSQGDQSKVTAQKVRADGLTGTEAGLTIVQDLLNTVRVMATQPSNCTSGDCWQTAKIATAPSTSLQKSLAYSNASAACNSGSTDGISKQVSEFARLGGLSASIASALSKTDASGTGWNDIENNRSYRVVSYQYEKATNTSTANPILGQGILTLEGRFRKTADASVADNSESRNRLVVSVPVYPSYPVAFTRTTAPALWISQGGIEDDNQTSGIKESSPTYGSGSNFQGDVVMSDATAFDDSTATLRAKLECYINSKKIEQPTGGVTPTYRSQFFSSLKFPSLPDMPTNLPASQQDIEITGEGTFPRTENGKIGGKIIDTPTTRNINGKDVQMYEYTVKNIDLNGKTVTIDPKYRVVFYVKGNISTNGSGGIQRDCSADRTTCLPTGLQIYAYNSSKDSNAQICLKGKENLEAFIFAPDYALGIQNKTTNFIGAMWGKSWGKISGCSENNQTAIIQGARWDDLIVNLKPAPLEELPQIGQVLTWCEESIDQTTATDCNKPGMPVWKPSPTTNTPTITTAGESSNPLTPSAAPAITTVNNSNANTAK